MQPQTPEQIIANRKKSSQEYRKLRKRVRETMAEMDRLEAKISKDLNIVIIDLVDWEKIPS